MTYRAKDRSAFAEGLLVGLAVARLFWESLPKDARRELLPALEELEEATKKWNHVTFLHKSWTEEEEASLRESYGKVPTEDVAERLGRTVESVNRKAFHMGLSWQDNWDHKSCKVCNTRLPISRKPNRSGYCKKCTRNASALAGNSSNGNGKIAEEKETTHGQQPAQSAGS